MPRKAFLKRFRRRILHHLRINLHKPAIGVPSRPPVAHHRPQPLHDFVIDAQIQDRIHHPRHRYPGAGTHRHQQRIFRRTKTMPDRPLQLAHPLPDHLPQPFRQPIPPGQIIAANLRRNHEPRRHRQPQPRHFAKIAALAAQQRRHRSIALAETVDHLRHRQHPPYFPRPFPKPNNRLYPKPAGKENRHPAPQNRRPPT